MKTKEAEDVLRRNAAVGDHNARILLTLAQRGGIPQGSTRLKMEGMMSEALIARWSRIEREFKAREDLLTGLLRRWADCREAHDTQGVCYEDHEALVLETDAALAPEPRQ